ncbi:RNA polymerase sigma factor [Fodinibius salsisoli]|uniref:Sigma-70 family RNA polymerase sigma factor n=1 Tax=Fodinibius salsisoli TaxID=2820877 RepID=A0ABT3PK63_9BACT|nr:sigma-70 family RNA polymerase sigma factor [Fodinibius salsisoli]MCW9706335.1 sigma-70 family RNA polymerase sigma factor [Fodinibius salsisoli]
MIQKIIEGCRNRQRESQKELYQMFYAYGMSITLRYAESREQAVAILNDAFMKVFTNISTFDDSRPFKPWLRQIIVNTAINHFHRNQNERRSEALDKVEDELNSRETIISGISYDEIIDMVQQLSPAYRTVFNLYVIEGFKHKEIAKMLDISIGTSKSNLSKAKRNLQSILEKNFI